MFVEVSMKINVLNSVNNIKFTSHFNKKNVQTFLLPTDTFVRTTTSFSSNKNQKDFSFESFSDWAETSLYLQSIDADHSKAKGKVLGSGFEGVVYEIPGTDRWVLKEYKRSSIIPLKSDKTSLVKIEDIIPDMNVGQSIACLKFPCGPNYSYYYYVRKRQNGITLGVDPKDVDRIHSYNLEGHTASLKLLSDAPQLTYDKLISDLNRIYDAGYEVDCSNLNNFLFDSENNSINFVDINDKHKNPGNQLADVLYSLLDTAFYRTFKDEDPEEKSAKSISLKYSKEIVTKFFAAMKKQNMKFVNSKYLDSLVSTDLLDETLGAKTSEEKINRLIQENLLS